MNYKTHETLFWKVASFEYEGSAPELTPEQKKQAERVRANLKELELKRIAYFDELRGILGYWAWESLQGESGSMCGYYSSDAHLEREEFSREQVAELNRQNILTETQHDLVTRTQNGCQIPFDADRIMSRRELTKEIGVSNDKITRFLKNGMPVLVKGENGQPDKFSAICVYRWLLSENYKNPKEPILRNWKDAEYFEDIGRNRNFHKCPSSDIKWCYKEARPEFFATEQA